MVCSLEENDPEGIDILDEDIKEDETKTKSVKEPSMDKIYKKAYKKKVVDSLDSSINLKLKRGEYYIYFPFLFTDKDVPSVTSAVLRISYKADGKKQQYISESSSYFTEYMKSEFILEKMFEEVAIMIYSDVIKKEEEEK